MTSLTLPPFLYPLLILFHSSSVLSLTLSPSHPIMGPVYWGCSFCLDHSSLRTHVPPFLTYKAQSCNYSIPLSSLILLRKKTFLNPPQSLLWVLTKVHEGNPKRVHLFPNLHSLRPSPAQISSLSAVPNLPNPVHVQLPPASQDLGLYLSFAGTILALCLGPTVLQPLSSTRSRKLLTFQFEFLVFIL